MLKEARRFLRIRCLAHGLIVMAFASGSLSGCSATKNMTNTEMKGLGVGAISGAILGAATGFILADGEDERKAAIVGGVAGVISGAGIGYALAKYLSKEDLAQVEKASASASEEALTYRKVATSNWTSATSLGVSGRSIATPTEDGCTDVQEIAIVPGQGEVTQSATFCKGGDGSLVRRA